MRLVPYPRAVGAADRRSAFGRPDEEYSRGFEYDGPRFYPNGAPRGYHGEDQRGYHGDGLHFANEQRSGPPARRQEDPYSYYRGAREDPLPGRQMDFRPSGRAIPPPSVRVQGSYPPPPPRPLSAVGPDPGDDTLMRAILNLDRGEDREALRRKGPYPPALREHSPLRKDVPPSPHSRSGSSVSSRSYSPDRAKGHAYQPPQSTRYEEPYGPNRAPDRDRVSGPSVSASRDGSPQSSVSVSKMSLENSSISLETLPGPKAEGLEKSSAATEAGGDPVREEGVVAEGPPDEALPATDEISTLLEDFHERRAQAISAKAREIEKVYRQDCETFGMVVKMLVAKEPSLEKHLQSPLKENLGEIRDRCLEDLRHFISELDEVVRQPEPSV